MTSTLTDIQAGSFIDAAGTRTHIHDVGTGQAVLLLHGSGPGVSAWANWQHTIPALSRGGRIIAPDSIGWGQTERRDDVRYSLRSWTDHVWSVLDALELDRVSIVGNSLGGRLALQMAEDAPSRIDRLVLMGSPGVGMTMTDGLKALRNYEPTLENMQTLLTTYFAVDTSIITDDVVTMRYEASAAPGAHEAYRSMFFDPKHAGTDLGITEQQVRAVAAQTLLVHGREDKVVPPEVAWTMVNLLPDADLHLFARCGHWTQIERAADFNRLVAAFLGLDIGVTK